MNYESDDRTQSSDLGKRIASIDATFSTGINKLEEVTRRDGALSARDKAILLVAAAAIRDREATTDEVERALALGNNTSQLQATALALYLSRGAAPCRAVLDAVDQCDPAPSGNSQADVAEVSSEQMLAEFGAIFGEVPARISQLADHSPQGLEAYYRMRGAVLSAGVLEPIVAELALVCVNAVEHRSDFAAVHVNGAIKAGATEEQLIEAGICAIASGGVAAWLSASEAIISVQSN